MSDITDRLNAIDLLDAKKLVVKQRADRISFLSRTRQPEACLDLTKCYHAAGSSYSFRCDQEFCPNYIPKNNPNDYKRNK